MSEAKAKSDRSAASAARCRALPGAAAKREKLNHNGLLELRLNDPRGASGASGAVGVERQSSLHVNLDERLPGEIWNR